MLPSVEHVDLVWDMELRDYLQGEVFWFRVEDLECVRVLKGERESVCVCLKGVPVRLADRRVLDAEGGRVHDDLQRAHLVKGVGFRVWGSGFGV